MATFISQISTSLLIFLFAATFGLSMSSDHKVVRCDETDRRTLLIFKQGIIDPLNQLSTWSNVTDCCAWNGVECHNTTGRVIKLDLFYLSLKGELNLSLLELEFLNYLDLSDNEFDVISIPPIHHNVTIASNLSYLDLSWTLPSIDNLQWISRLSSLTYLNIGGTDLQREINWLQLLAMLPSLSELRLPECKLNSIGLSLMHANFTSLVTLVLSDSNLNSVLPYWLFNLSSGISHIELQGNSFHGEIPLSSSSLRNLSYLDLSGNKLSGSIPDWIGQQQNLEHLDLSSNQLTGSIPNWIGHQEHLQHLDLSRNQMTGSISNWIGPQENLQHLDLSYNQLRGSIPNWIGQQRNLEHLDLSYNLFRGSLPSSLGNITSLISLSAGSTSLSGAISEIHFSKLKHLEHLDLSNSTFSFHLSPEWIPPFQLSWLSLANTNQGPRFPSWIYTQNSLRGLDISSSGISFIDDKFWHFVGGIDGIYLSNNSISGDISNVILNSTDLNLDQNNFTGGLPRISPEAVSIDLSHNSFSGPIPHGWENWENLKHLNLWSNRLSGELPTDLSNCTQLEVLNIGKNEFSGTLSTRMPANILVMILRSNQFEGNIPPLIFNLSFLFHLDLAHNKLSGSIPHYAYNMTQMITQNSRLYLPGSTIDLFTKGQYYEPEMYSERRTVDLSANELSGEIPLELFELTQLQTLNLSHNHLTGMIDETIGSMKNLESLDFSNNNLSGEIPQSMAGLSFLQYLNLSCNNFIGQIPTGTQLQGFDASSYVGNTKLCGPPLAKCIINKENPENAKQDAGNDGDNLVRNSLYLGMGVGFAVSFWGICGSLILIRKWRHSYYQFLDQIADKFYVTLTVMINDLRKSEATTS